MPFNLETWDGFSEIPKRDLDFLIDTEAINKRLAARANNPYRLKTGSFTAPKYGIKREQFDKIVEQSCSKFVEVMEKQGWALSSKLRVRGPFLARDLESKFVMLEKHEYRVEGIFKHTKSLQKVRIELPP